MTQLGGFSALLQPAPTSSETESIRGGSESLRGESMSVLGSSQLKKDVDMLSKVNTWEGW